MPENVQILNSGFMQRVTALAGFYDKFPEFKTLKAQESVYSSGGGCRGCRKQIKISGMFSTFLSLVLNIGPEKIQKLKEFVGADKLYFNGINPATGKIELKVL